MQSGPGGRSAKAAVLRRDRVVFVGGAAVALALVLLGVQFAAFANHRATVGTTLGADYAEFYLAGQALNQGHASQLYDDGAQARRLHRLFPQESAAIERPYVYPPWVAEAFRPLASLPYALSYAVWLTIGVLLALGALVAIRPLVPSMSSEDWRVAALVGLAFEPLLFECWVGGQLSLVALAALCLGLRLEHDRHPLAAGVALGVLAYKPPLLLFILPLLLLSRRWRSLVALVGTAAVGLGLSVGLTGRAVTQSYVRRLTTFSRSSSGAGELVVRQWKYVDLRSVLGVVAGRSSPIAVVVAAVAVVGGFVVLFRAWTDPDLGHRPAVWAATVTATLVANFYVPVYDAALLVPAALLTWDAVAAGRDAAARRQLAGLLGVAWGAAWIGQPLARSARLPVDTLVIAMLLGAQLRILRWGPGPGGGGPRRRQASWVATAGGRGGMPETSG